MVTLDKVCDNLLAIIKGGRISDDYTPTRKQIKFIIEYYRALFIRRDLSKFEVLGSTFEQSLGSCVEMQVIDPSECDDIPTGCTILRSVLPIPKPIRLKKGYAYQVFSADNRRTITPIRPDQAEFLTGNLFTSRELVHFYRNGYIYVPTSRTLTNISVIGIFEDPTDAARFCLCNGKPCYSDSDPYPISEDYVQQITQASLGTEFKVMLGITKDDVNDGKDR